MFHDLLWKRKPWETANNKGKNERIKVLTHKEAMCSSLWGRKHVKANQKLRQMKRKAQFIWLARKINLKPHTVASLNCLSKQPGASLTLLCFEYRTLLQGRHGSLSVGISRKFWGALINEPWTKKRLFLFGSLLSAFPCVLESSQWESFHYWRPEK